MIYIVFGDLWWNLSIPWKYATPQQSTHSTVASFSVCHKWSCMVLWCRTFTRKYSGGSNANHHLLSCVYAACHALGSSTAIVFNMSYRFLFGDSFFHSFSLSLFPSLVMSYYIPCMQENDELKWPRFVWLHKSGPISICHGCVPIGGIWILYQTRQQSKKDNLFSTSSASSYCVAGMATRSTWKFQFKHMLITKPNGEWFFHRMNVNPFENMVTHNAQLIFSVKQRSWTMESKQFIRVCVCVCLCIMLYDFLTECFDSKMCGLFSRKLFSDLSRKIVSFSFRTVFRPKQTPTKKAKRMNENGIEEWKEKKLKFNQRYF